jgi:hypothetical protein
MGETRRRALKAASLLIFPAPDKGRRRSGPPGSSATRKRRNAETALLGADPLGPEAADAKQSAGGSFILRGWAGTAGPPEKTV